MRFLRIFFGRATKKASVVFGCTTEPLLVICSADVNKFIGVHVVSNEAEMGPVTIIESKGFIS